VAPSLYTTLVLVLTVWAWSMQQVCVGCDRLDPAGFAVCSALELRLNGAGGAGGGVCIRISENAPP
jgi:hypothetical protein